MHLGNFNNHFQEQFGQLQKTNKFMEQIMLQLQGQSRQSHSMPSNNLGGRVVPMDTPGATHGGNYYQGASDMGGHDFEEAQRMQGLNKQ